MRTGAIIASFAWLVTGCGRFGFEPGASPDGGSDAGPDAGPLAIAVGKSFACTVRQGAIWCWGDDHDGQLGDNATTPHPPPVRAMRISDATSLLAGTYQACA